VNFWRGHPGRLDLSGPSNLALTLPLISFGKNNLFPEIDPLSFFMEIESPQSIAGKRK
jgi:hypothetical protein